MSYNMDKGNRVDAGRPEKFRGKCTTAGFVEGQLDSGQITKQLFLVWTPNDEEMNPQPSWYSMGQREFEFGGEEEDFELGTKIQTLYEKIVDGDAITKTSWIGILFDRLDDIGFTVKGASAKQFIGIEADLEREEYPQKSGKKLENVGDNLLPVKLVGKGKSDKSDKSESTSDKDSDTGDDDIDNVIIAAVDGKTDEDMTKVLKTDRIKALKIKSTKFFKRLDALIESGRLTKEDGKYEEA